MLYKVTWIMQDILMTKVNLISTLSTFLKNFILVHLEKFYFCVFNGCKMIQIITTERHFHSLLVTFNTQFFIFIIFNISSCPSCQVTVQMLHITHYLN